MRQICKVFPQCGKNACCFLYSVVLIFSFFLFVSLLVSKVFLLFFSCECHPTASYFFWVTVTPTTLAITLNVHCIPLLNNRVAISTANEISQRELYCSLGANFYTNWWYASFTFWVLPFLQLAKNSLLSKRSKSVCISATKAGGKGFLIGWWLVIKKLLF